MEMLSMFFFMKEQVEFIDWNFFYRAMNFDIN